MLGARHLLVSTSSAFVAQPFGFRRLLRGGRPPPAMDLSGGGPACWGYVTDVEGDTDFWTRFCLSLIHI